MSVRGRAVSWLVAALAVLASCSSDGGSAAPSASSTTSTASTTPITTTSSEPPTTTEAPTTTTTTEPPAPPAPPPPPVALWDAPVVVTPTGVVAPVVRRNGGGVLVRTPCGATATIGSGTPIPGAEVVLDAGHGGVEHGATGPNGLTEKVLNLGVVEHARNALESAGHATVLTRAADYRMTLEARAAVVKALGPRAFVSVHHNAEPDGPWPRPGVETYYQIGGSSTRESKRLAGLLQEEVVAALSQYSLSWVADADAGAKFRKNSRGDDYYGIIRQTQGTPAALAELGFISNAPEADLYARPDVQRTEGEAVARAVVRFLTTADPGSGFTDPYPRDTPAGPGGGSSSCRDPDLG